MTNAPIRLREIDATNRASHPHYRSGERWLFLWEKTSGRDYSFSETNNLISNLKKSINSSAAQLRYKQQAIQKCAAALREAINPAWLDVGTLVPVPPSKCVNDPLYDDRMEQVCRLIRPERIDVRSLVKQDKSMPASHENQTGERNTVQSMIESYKIDETLVEPEPSHIAIVDDMLTAGTHYRAMHYVLSQRFPTAEFFGCFIARRVFPDET